MRRKQVLSAASKILARGASSSPPPSQCLCLRMTPTTLTRNTMSTLYSAQSGRALALAPQGRPPRLDRSKVNLAWFLSAILSSPPPSFSLSFLSHLSLAKHQHLSLSHSRSLSGPPLPVFCLRCVVPTLTEACLVGVVSVFVPCSLQVIWILCNFMPCSKQAQACI